MIPESEIGDLIVELRSATAGVGTFSTRFDHMAELDGRPAEMVLPGAEAPAAHRRIDLSETLRRVLAVAALLR